MRSEECIGKTNLVLMPGSRIPGLSFVLSFVELPDSLVYLLGYVRIVVDVDIVGLRLRLRSLFLFTVLIALGCKSDAGSNAFYDSGDGATDRGLAASRSALHAVHCDEADEMKVASQGGRVVIYVSLSYSERCLVHSVIGTGGVLVAETATGKGRRSSDASNVSGRGWRG